MPGKPWLVSSWNLLGMLHRDELKNLFRVLDTPVCYLALRNIRALKSIAESGRSSSALMGRYLDVIPTYSAVHQAAFWKCIWLPGNLTQTHFVGHVNGFGVVSVVHLGILTDCSNIISIKSFSEWCDEGRK